MFFQSDLNNFNSKIVGLKVFDKRKRTLTVGNSVFYCYKDIHVMIDYHCFTQIQRHLYISIDFKTDFGYIRKS